LLFLLSGILSGGGWEEKADAKEDGQRTDEFHAAHSKRNAQK